MTTSELLEKITNAGEFEILATRVLREIDPDCQALEHTGINAGGRTISGPIDGFCLVPGSDPPRFVCAQHTTTSRGKLKDKWLFDHVSRGRGTSGDDGDLTKAHKEATSLRVDHPGAQFVVHLCTNQRVSSQLMSDVYKRARELGIEARILAQSRLRDYLDATPLGHWLRKEHLGVDAEMLSWELLAHLSARSLDEYAGDFLAPVDSFVRTKAQSVIESSIGTRVPLSVLLGRSGAGKSVTSYQALRDHIQSNGIGFRIHGPIASEAQSLESAIALTLLSIYPSIESGAGARALDLASSSGMPLLVVIDDINRTQTPSETLRKIVQWSRPARSDPESALKGDSERHVLVVPAWHSHWAPFEHEHRGSARIASVHVERMTCDEAAQCLRGALKSQLAETLDIHLDSVVSSLEHDPILIALFADLKSREPDLPTSQLTSDVMARFVSASIDDVAATGTRLTTDYELALRRLVDWMLKERDLHPTWDDARSSLSDDDTAAIRELTRGQRICRVVKSVQSAQFEFRHDRILEHICAGALVSKLGDLVGNADVLSDPFYAEYVGRALARSSPSKEIVDWVREHAPLALFAGLGLLREGDPSRAHIVAAAREWLEGAMAQEDAPDALRWMACRQLETIDSPLVLEVTRSVSKHPWLYRARLANGDPRAGVLELADGRSLEVRDRSLDWILGRALGRHSDAIRSGCGRVLEASGMDDRVRTGALALAGYVGEPILASSLAICWEGARDKQAVVVPTLWAALHCYDGDTSLLDSVMKVWSSLPEEPGEFGRSERGDVPDSLRFALKRRCVPRDALEFLVKRARTDGALRWPITYLLEELDDPLVVRFMAEEAASTEKRLRGTDRFSPWLQTLPDRWDPTIDSPGRGRRLSSEAIDVLKLAWESDDSDDDLKISAFRIWVRATDDVAILKQVPPDHPLVRSVLWRRVRLGDMSVVPSIASLILEDRGWFRVIAHVWCEALIGPTEEALSDLRDSTPPDYSGGHTDDHYALSGLLRDIRIEDAEPLLIRYWDQLQFSCLFIQCALFLGTPQCVKRADKAIRDYPSARSPWEHLHFFFGFETVGLRDRIRLKHLEVLLPYLQSIDDHNLSSLAGYCAKSGHRDWAIQHLEPEFRRRTSGLPTGPRDDQPYLPRMAQAYFPTDKELLDDLSRVEGQGRVAPLQILRWCDEFERRQDDHGRWRRLLEEWMIDSPTMMRFRLVAEAVQHRGLREDLELLDPSGVAEDDHQELEAIIANARVAVMRRSPR